VARERPAPVTPRSALGLHAQGAEHHGLAAPLPTSAVLGVIANTVGGCKEAGGPTTGVNLRRRATGDHGKAGGERVRGGRGGGARSADLPRKRRNLQPNELVTSHTKDRAVCYTT
jgi:hypothetical protein